ncbi:hypothetical protein L1987_33677 [Smallanthus sonchifolius]|uniref:Uncharacterized protein n=1 Tax=Smallanthus sonchifolius TaxID=185202 RepID=A0ACB9HUA0_9ASTR|nr:hypothetical protein L1987_33677 [Smallanthus sonchifolius]
MGYVNSQSVRKNKADDQDEDSSWLPSQSSKIDESWLPTNSTITSESKGSRHRKVDNNVDDSWLPTVDDNNGKYGTNMNESENDIDYSWLPSTFIDNNKNKQKDDNNIKNTTKTKTKNTNTSMNKNNNKSNSNSNNNNNSSPQKKSRNDHWAMARKVVFPSDQQHLNVAILKKTSSDTSHLQQQDSPSKSRYVVESPTSGGVSSLLQRWKDLAEVENSNNGNKSPPSNGNSSRSTCKENTNDNASHSPPTSSTVEDSNANLESDKASRSRRFSCPLPSRDSKDSNPGGAEKENIRVVDIIKKLSREEELAAYHAAGHGNQSLPPIRTTLRCKQTEGGHKGINDVKVSRHLIRGRQAFDSFLMQMERDKHHELKWLVERKAVSKFSHRGRIQSMLRFKILRLGAEPKPEPKIHRCRVSKPLESNNRDIMDLRERFSSGIEKGATESRKHKRNDLKNIINQESPAITSTTTELEIKTKTKTTTSKMKQEPQPKPEPMTPNQSTQHSTTSCKDVVHKAKFEDSCSSPIMLKEDRHYKNDNKYEFYEDEGQFMSAKTSYGQMEDRDREMQALDSFHDWMASEYSRTPSDLDEDESSEMQLFDTDYDWISDISRPKSEWEDMRQARKSVSSFLGSSMRDLIDQLMVSRSQQSHAQVEKQDVVVRVKEESSKEVVREDGSMLDDDEDCRSRTKTKCSEYSEYVDQTAYSVRSWRPNDVVCNSETTTTATTSPSIERSLSSNRSHNNSTPQSSPAITHHTIEMELIYDLRGHMVQLHNDITELRKSIKSCVNMQVKLQHSFKQNVVTASTRSVQRKERKPPDIVNHNCSICYDMPVDSLLYRCGHMCTCFKCALELQRTGEECPVCEAPIVDVVKAMCS